MCLLACFQQVGALPAAWPPCQSHSSARPQPCAPAAWQLTPGLACTRPRQHSTATSVLTSLSAAMNFLRRRLSDSSFVANLPNGYMPDLQRPDSSTSSPASPATERRHTQPLAASFSSPGSSLFGSFTGAMKPSASAQAPAGPTEPAGPATPVVQRPRVLLVIDDAHTDW